MQKKVVGRHLLHIWTSTNPRNLTNQDSQLLDSSRPYGRLLENQKPGGSRKLFLAWKWFPRYLKILSLANSLIANNNIRSIILEIKNNRCKIVNTNILFSLPRTLWKCCRERERNISILTILHLSFLISNMMLLILLFAFTKIAPQKIFQKNTQILITWKPTEDMKFRLEFFLHVPLNSK